MIVFPATTHALGFGYALLIPLRNLYTRMITAVLLTVGNLSYVDAGLAAPINHYDKLLFVCRSVDPSDTRLNLRSRPGGIVKDTISRTQDFYVWGNDLSHPQFGYVPVHFRSPSSNKAGQIRKELPSGWVWKTYITCELSS